MIQANTRAQEQPRKPKKGAAEDESIITARRELNKTDILYLRKINFFDELGGGRRLISKVVDCRKSLRFDCLDESHPLPSTASMPSKTHSFIILPVVHGVLNHT